MSDFEFENVGFESERGAAAIDIDSDELDAVLEIIDQSAERSLGQTPAQDYSYLSRENLEHAERFDRWFGRILSALIESAHEIVKLRSSHAFNRIDEALLNSPHIMPTAVILHGVTRTDLRKSKFVNDCLASVPVQTKIAYGQKEWGEQSAAQAAEVNLDFDLQESLGTYAYFLDGDYYSGQTVRSFDKRWGEHEYVFRKSSAAIARYFRSRKRVPAFYEQASRSDKNKIISFISSLATDVRSDEFLREIRNTTLESAWTVYLGSMSQNDLNGSLVVEWIQRTRPSDMPAVS